MSEKTAIRGVNCLQTTHFGSPADGRELRFIARHPKLRGPDFDSLYDFTTVVYDIFRSGATATLVCPPLRPAEVSRSLRFYSGEEELSFEYDRRNYLDFIKVEIPNSLDNVDISYEGRKATANLSESELGVFRGKRTIVTANKDNSLQWILDWAHFNVRHSGCDAVVLYDNGSTAYSKDELAECLDSVDGLDTVRVVDWPFRWGVTDGITDGAYTQRAMLEHARRRFLNGARSVLQCDIDELVLADDEPILDAVERSDKGYINFSGKWVHPVRDPQYEEMGTPRHKYFSSTDLSNEGWCGRKWACVPSRIGDDCQWMVHEIWGGVKADTELSGKFSLRHFKALNTGWKHSDRAAMEAPFKSETKLREALDACFNNVPRRYEFGDYGALAKKAFAGGAITQKLKFKIGRALVEEYPDDARLLFLAARFEQSQGNDDLSLSLFDRLLAQDDSIADGHYYMSYPLERAVSREAATAAARKALAIEPAEPRYVIRLLTLLTKSGLWQEALETASSFWEDQSPHPKLAVFLARSLWKTGERERAISLLRDADGLFPSDPEIKIVLANLLFEKESFADSKAKYLEAQNQDPDRPWIYYRLSQIEQREGSRQKALQFAKTAVQKGGGKSTFVNWLAELNDEAVEPSP